MNDKNYEGAAVAVAIGLIFLVLKFLFALAVAIAILVTAAFSVISIIAMLNGGLTLFGEHITAREGKMFFVRGLIGMLTVSIIAGLVVDLLHQPIPFSPPWVWFGGFALGSVGGEYAIQQMKDEQAKSTDVAVLPPIPDYDPYQPPVRPPVQREPSPFASWEDEEIGR